MSNFSIQQNNSSSPRNISLHFICAQFVQQLMQMHVIVFYAAVSIYNGPHNNKNEEENTNSYHAPHIEHLSQFVANKNPKSRKEEDRKNPRPHQHLEFVHTRTITLTTCIKHAQENQNENHNV